MCAFQIQSEMTWSQPQPDLLTVVQTFVTTGILVDCVASTPCMRLISINLIYCSNMCGLCVT
jgi:hypothetical protein